MDYPEIKKPPISQFTIKPNLDHYDDITRAFTWDQMKQNLDGLPGGGLNLAHEAIDRHATGAKSNKVALYWEGVD